MKRNLFILLTLAVASFLTACGDSGAGNAGNKPANAAASNAAAAPAPDKAAVEAEVRKTMDDFNTALNKGVEGIPALEKIYSDDYTLVDQNGVMQTKASRIEAIKSGKLKWEGLKFSDLKVKTHPAGDGAIVTGHVMGKVTADGKTEDRNSIVTWVLGKSKDKGWQFMNAQITDVKAGAAKSDDKAKADDKSKMNESQKKTGDPKVDALAGDDIEPPKKK